MTLQYSPYPAYKPSGIPWLGNIPAHWKIVRVKHLAANVVDAVQTGPFGAQLHASDYIEDGIPLILIKNVMNLRIEDSNIPRISFEKAKDLAQYRLKSGDLVFSRVGSIGRIALTTKREEGWLISGQMLRMRLNAEAFLDNRFSVYLFSCGDILKFIDLKSVGSTRESINTDILRNLPLILPPLPEQQAIAAYLDRETARLDALADRYRRLLALLDEKRRALITHAVTRGLNPAAPLKDSGIEWLGDIPAHWEVLPLKYCTEFINGAPFKPSDWLPEGIPIIRIENLNGGEEFNYTVLELDQRYEVSENDLLFGWSGNRGTSFGPFIWKKTGKYYLNQHIFKLHKFNFEKKYFYWLLKAATFFIESQAHGIIGLVHITKKDLGNIDIPIIPIEDQQAIAAYLDRETTRLDDLKAKIETLLARLGEHRAALISAAVTGKMDVHRPAG